MRNPNRLYEFYAELQRIHIEHFPDWRFGQFMINFLNAAERDPFFLEEDECLYRLRKFAGEFNELS